jgi:predicted amidophosphoribosyltransferase
MPTYKHPCPHCGAFIHRDVKACPACGRPDPFAPARCPNCKATVEPAWVACPSCGQPIGAAAEAAAAAEAGETATAATTTAAPGAEVMSPELPRTPSRTCAGCGAALPDGARFCQECGTVAA